MIPTAMVRVTWNGDQIKLLERELAVDGMREVMELFYRASQRWAPELTGALKRSGRWTVDVGRLRGELHYGEGLPDGYAVIEHEKVEIHHAGGGRAKFVEGPMKQLGREAAQLLAAKFRSRMM